MVLVSGDGDYIPAVEFLRNQGHRIEVMSFGPSTSSKLQVAADEFIDMNENYEKYLLNPKLQKRRK
jgi:uncharacterized LabA/DUF88 family protein